jgi:2,3,4,5-tetrahydropyridine-2-carboxylate N-succinyltransferase
VPQIALSELRSRIEQVFEDSYARRTDAIVELLADFRAELNAGRARAVDLINGRWQVNGWVRKGIVLHARFGHLIDTSAELQSTSFEYDTMPVRRFSLEEAVRVPGGSTIRDGCYLARGVVCLPPSFVNIGVYVDEASTIDSHCSIGACTRIGKRVAINPGVQIGGVMQPIEMLPTIIGDDAILGGQSGVYDGVLVSAGAVIAAGVVLTRQSVLYDPRRKETHRSAPGGSLIVPPMAVVVAGARFLDKGAGVGSGLLANVPVIAGYRDDPNLGEFVLSELMN